MATNDPRNRVAMENDGSRVDARAKVTGAARYTHDINLPNMIYGTHIRVPFAEATLASYDVEAAKKVKGVLEVVIDEKGRGEYGGQSCGHIVAESMGALDDAMAALKTVWEHGTPKVSLRKEAGAVPADPAEQEAIYAKAAHVVELTFETQVQHHVCLETHGGVIHRISDTEARAWGSTQGTFLFRDGIARDLKLDREQIDFTCDYIGGGFGSKFSAGIEGKLAAEMTLKYNRPCKVMNNRKDESRDTGMRPGSLQHMKLAIDEKGKILGGRAFTFGGVGSRGGGGGLNYAEYDLGVFAKEHDDVKLSSCSSRPQRAPGCPQASFALEGIMDELAAKIGMDPVRFRKVNDPVQYRHHQYDIATKEIGWDRRKPDGQWPGAVKRGFGCGGAFWHNDNFPTYQSEIRIYPSGNLDIRSGIQDIGTGNRTMLVDLVAYKMGLDRDFITGLCGHTVYPGGPPSGGSVVARAIAPSVMHTADKAKAAILSLVAPELEVEAKDLEIKGDTIVSKTDSTKSISWKDACRLIAGDHMSVIGGASREDKGADREYRGTGESYGVALADVSVDTETGEVRIHKIVNVQQCGIPINRKTAESQIIGGTIQGISFAMFEERILDPVNGAPINPNMEWYRIAGPTDMPEIIPILDVPDGHDGVRALGEPPIVAVPSAIANAVSNAIGARITELPITPANVLAALKRKGGVA